MTQEAETTLAVQQVKAIAINPVVNERGIVVSSFDELWRLASAAARSGLAPKGLGNTEAVFIAMEMGMKLGLDPMTSLRGVAVINSKPSLYGDVAIGLVQKSGLLEYCKERIEGEGDSLVCYCEVKRKDKPPKTQRFSWADAKRAGLANKDTYKNYPGRMCMWRARSWAFRDEFADVLQGMTFAEEAMDIPPTNGEQSDRNASILNRIQQATTVTVSPPTPPQPSEPSVLPPAAESEPVIKAAAETSAEPDLPDIDPELDSSALAMPDEQEPEQPAPVEPGSTEAPKAVAEPVKAVASRHGPSEAEQQAIHDKEAIDGQPWEQVRAYLVAEASKVMPPVNAAIRVDKYVRMASKRGALSGDMSHRLLVPIRAGKLLENGTIGK